MPTEEALKSEIEALEREWDRNDDSGNYARCREISSKLERLRFEYAHVTHTPNSKPSAPEDTPQN
jgi:hypothetical protein